MLSIYITRNSAGKKNGSSSDVQIESQPPELSEGNDVHAKAKTVKHGKWEQIFKLSIYFVWKSIKKNSFGSRINNKPHIAIFKTKHTVATDRNEIIHKKVIFYPIHFQNAVTPINTSVTAVTDRPSCSTTVEPVTTCGYWMEVAPNPWQQGKKGRLVDEERTTKKWTMSFRQHWQIDRELKKLT